MGTVHHPLKAVLFTGLLFNEGVDLAGAREILQDALGPIIIESEPFQFTESEYYAEEMGAPLLRAFIAYDNYIAMDRIAEIKRSTNRIEAEVFSSGGRRKVNIDPGYLTSAKVVLATTKDYGHRIYLADGIYAEVTLRYSAREKTFLPWQWTYRDYQRDESLRFFRGLRDIYKRRIKTG
jgi:hypothetical protein